jgi:hypothetical protein
MTWNIYRTTDAGFMYPSLNQTHIRLAHARAWEDPTDTLEVTLTNSAPWFDHYEMRMDGRDWKSAPDSLSWALHPGDNSLEVRTIDRMNNAGVVSRVVVQDNLK